MLFILSSFRYLDTLTYREAFINVILGCIKSRMPFDVYIAQRESLVKALEQQISAVKADSKVYYFKTELKRETIRDLFETGECQFSIYR